MAHELSIREDGRAEMAYSGPTPWHSLGNYRPGLQTAREMLEAATMLWTVSTRDLYILDRKAPGSYPIYKQVSGHVSIARDDTDAVLGVARKGYYPIQNTDGADIVDAVVAEGGACVEVAGALRGGAVCWMLAQLPGGFEVVAGDKVNPYFLLAWGHDGQHGVAGKLTKTRVVCANTLAAAGFAGHGKWSTSADIFIRHTSGAKLNIAEARKALGLVQKQITATKDAYQALVVPIADEQAAQFFAGVFEQPAGVPSTATDDEKRTYNEKLTRWNRHQGEIVKLYTTTGKGLEIPGVRGTAWAAYNAVTEWVDHVYPVLADGSVSQVRQQAVAFGSYSQAKERALVSALALAGGKEADAA